MKCLLLTPFVPFPPVDGGRVRILGLLDGLAGLCDVMFSRSRERERDHQAVLGLKERGHVVEAVVEEPPSAIAVGRELVRGRSLYLAKYRSTAFATALASRLSASQFDVVQCEYPTPLSSAWAHQEPTQRGCWTPTISSTR